MPLEFTPLEIPYGQLDTRTDPTAMEPGTLTTAENVSSQVDGRYSKRNGYEALARVGTAPVRLARRGKALYAFDQLTYKRYDAALSFWDGGTISIPSAKPTDKIVALNQSKQLKKSSRASYNGIAMHAWIDASSGDVTVRIYDEETGAILTGYDDSSNHYDIIHAIRFGTQFVVFYSSSAGQVIRYCTFDPSAQSFGTLTTWWSGADVYAGTVGYPYAPFDVCEYSSSEVCFAWTTDTPEIKTIRRNVLTHTNTTAALTLTAEVPDGGFGLGLASTTFAAVMFHSSSASAVRIRGFNPTAATALFALATVEADAGLGTNFNCGLCAIDSTNLKLVWDRRGIAPTKGSTAWKSVNSAGTISSGILHYNIFCQGKPFTYGTHQYVPVIAPYSTQETYFVMDITAGASALPITMHAYRTAYADTPGVACLSDIDNPETGVYFFDAPYGYKFLSNSTLNAAVGTFKLDFTYARRFMFAEIGDSVMLTGGFTFREDGIFPAENNFLLYPEITSATAGTVASGGMDDGVYSYIVVFECADLNGNVDRSTTSLPASATTSGGAGKGKVTLIIDYLPISMHRFSGQPVVASIFRTEAGGETYYCIGSQEITVGLSNFTYVDQANDSTIIGNRIVYTQGGILDREPAPPCEQFVVHNNRVWGFTGKTVFYSGDYVPGENPWFSTIQQFRIDPGGEITALASLDEKLIIFKSDRIFKVTGRGCNATGSGSDLTPPDVIISDCGCIESRSVVVVPQGVIFLSDKGLYLLTRGEELTFIGLPVDRYVTNYPTITAATMMPTVQEIRFQAIDDDGNGVVLVYNYRDNRWTTHTNYDYLGAGGTGARADALVVNGDYYTIDQSGYPSRETDGYLDPSDTYVTSELETGWIKPTGKQGLARVQRATFLSEFVDGHNLAIEIDKDYVASSVQSAAFTSSEIQSFPEEQVSLHIQNQQGEAWRFRLRDSEGDDTSTGEGFMAKGVTLLVGAKRGTVEKIMQAGSKA